MILSHPIQTLHDLQEMGDRLRLLEAAGADGLLAEVIIDALRLGTAPVKGCLLLSVGREDLLKLIRNELRQVSDGKAVLRVLSGTWGIGKSLVLRILQEYAFENNFAASFVTLTPRECPLFDLRAVYQHIVKAIRVSTCRDKPALESLLTDWADRVRASVQTDGKAPWSFWELSPWFKDALAMYFEAEWRGNFTAAQRALSWIHGDMTTTNAVRQAGIQTPLTSENALQMLGNLTRMIRQVGYKGLVILLDEAETIPSVCGDSKCEQAYSNLVLLSNSAGSTPFSYFVYATTPMFFDHIGPSRIRTSTPVWKLDNLGKSDLTKLALMIRDLYLTAYEWHGDNRTTDHKLRQFLSDGLFKCFEQQCTPRLAVRAVVRYLDICHSSKAVNAVDIVNSLRHDLSDT